MPFTNPIVGGGGDLIIDKIRSPDFVTGVSGWQIAKDGTAELNETTVRGPVHVIGTTGVIDIEPDPTRPTISFWNTLHNNRSYINVVDDFNANYANLGINGGTVDSVGIPGATLRPRLYMIGPTESASALGHVRQDVPDYMGGQFLFTDNTAFMRAYLGDGSGTAIADVQCIRGGSVIMKGSTDGVTRNGPELRVGGAPSAGYLHVVNEDWNDFAFNNSWTTSSPSSDQVHAGYKLLGDGTVIMRGRISNATVGKTGGCFNLPAGYFPAKQGRWVVAHGATPVSSDGILQITTGGVATIERNAATSSFFYLDTVQFSTV